MSRNPELLKVTLLEDEACQQQKSCVISRNEILFCVRVITKKRLVEFAKRHPDAKEPLFSWHHIVEKRDFVHFADLRKVFPSADLVGKLTVFNIGGNKYRLITSIHYNRKIVYIRHVLTHSEYNAGNWKE